MQKIALKISYPEEKPLPSELLRLTFDAPAVNLESSNPRDNPDMRLIDGAKSFRQSLSSDQPTLGRVLRNRREEMGLSQAELALKLGIKARDVAQLEGDRGARPSFQLLSRAASILGLDKDRLIQLSETGSKSISGGPKVVPHRKDNGQIFAAFAGNRTLLARYNVKPQELKALSQVSLMGKVADTEALLFILEAIRKAGDTDE